MIYQAGVTLHSSPRTPISGLMSRKLGGGTYARFLLTGPYVQVWPAFNEMFRTLAERKVSLRREFCVENYLNDPKVTPEDQLQSELLVPVS